MSSRTGHQRDDAAPNADGSALQIVEQQQPTKVENGANDQEGPKVNFDQDIDSLRKMFVTVISDYAVR